MLNNMWLGFKVSIIAILAVEAKFSTTASSKQVFQINATLMTTGIINVVAETGNVNYDIQGRKCNGKSGF